MIDGIDVKAWHKHFAHMYFGICAYKNNSLVYCSICITGEVCSFHSSDSQLNKDFKSWPNGHFSRFSSVHSFLSTPLTEPPQYCVRDYCRHKLTYDSLCVNNQNQSWVQKFHIYLCIFWRGRWPWTVHSSSHTVCS